MVSRPIAGSQKLSGTLRLRHLLFALSVGVALLCYYLLIDFASSEPPALSGEIVTASSALHPAQERGLRAFLVDYFGWYAYILPLYLAFVGYMVFYREYDLRNIDLFHTGLVILGFNCLTIGLCALFSFMGAGEFSGYGGILGDFLCNLLIKLTGTWLAPLLAVLISFAGICLFFVIGPLTMAERLGAFFSRQVLSRGSGLRGYWAAAAAKVRRLLSRQRAPDPASPGAAQPYPEVRPFEISDSHFDENHMFRAPAAGSAAGHSPEAPGAARGYFERTEPVFGPQLPGDELTAQPAEPQLPEVPAADPEPAQGAGEELQEDPQTVRLRRAQARRAEAARAAREAQEEEAKAEAARQERRRRRFAQQFGPHDDPDDNPYARRIADSQPQPHEDEPDDGRPTTIITHGDHTRRPLYGSAAEAAEDDPGAEAAEDELPTTIITRTPPRSAPAAAAERPADLQDAAGQEPQAPGAAEHRLGSSGDYPDRGGLPRAPQHWEEDPAGEERAPNVISFSVDQEEAPRTASFEINEDALPAAFIPRQGRVHPAEDDPHAEQVPAAAAPGSALERNISLISEKDASYSYGSARRGVMPAQQEHSAAPAPSQGLPPAAPPRETPAPAPVQPAAARPAVSAAGAQILARNNLNMISAPQHAYGLNRPSCDLLTPSSDDAEPDAQMFLEMAGKIDSFLKNFKVRATVDRYLSGPVITRYDLALEPGVKSKTIADLVNDLCRDLMVSSIRFKGIVEGSDYVGLEVPNPQRKLICLYDVVRTEEFMTSQAALPIVLGVNETGGPVVVDLARAPHLLIAGTTGSGKSAGLNAMLVSLLLKRSPQELRLILIDPKQLEFSLYEDIPHLITPVITDVAEKTAAALRWCVEEMERRYNLIASMRCRKLDEYNELIDRAAQAGQEVCDPAWSAELGGTPPLLRRLPYIVVVVEEYADLMAQTSSRKKNENSPEALIARLTAKARAAGIHVVLATQTPRADVVTSVIKANLPSRIAYTVQSALDSRIILDEAGAEKLLGYGDMLSKFYGYNNSATFRAHGAFVSNDDVQRVCAAWRQLGGPPEYIDGVTDSPQEDESDDELPPAAMKLDKVFDEAAAFARDFYVRKQKYPTTSDYQANFGLGWARAKKLVNQLIKEGVVEE